MSESSYRYNGVYLPTSGGIVLLACDDIHYSRVVDLNAGSTDRRNSKSFSNSIGLKLLLAAGERGSLLPPAGPYDFFFSFSLNMRAFSSSAIRYIS